MSQAAAEFMSVPEAAARLGRSCGTIQRLIRAGRLTAIEIPGSHTRILASSVDAYVPALLHPGPSAQQIPVRLPIPA